MVRKSFKSFGRYWLPVLLYCVAIFIQSSLPPANPLDKTPYSDKLLHFGAYALLGVLLWRALIHTWPNGSRRQLMLVGTLAAALYGLSDEIHQAFVPLRQAEALDFLFDVLGGMAGVGLAAWLSGPKAQRAPFP